MAIAQSYGNKKAKPPKFSRKNDSPQKITFFVRFFMIFKNSCQSKIALEIFLYFVEKVSKITYFFTVGQF